jgi:hypothetical protein
LSPTPRGPFVSIVVAVRDGADWLAELLPSLAEQEAEVIAEIVAVDCGSVDDTMERLGDADARIIAVDAFSPGGVPLATAARYARGNVLVFLEQGVVPTGRDWLASLLSGFDDDEVVAVCSRLPGVDGFHGAATALRAPAIDGIRGCELDTWPAAVLRAGLKVRIEPSALVSQQPATARQLIRAGLAEGLRRGVDESEDDLLAAIRADWRALAQCAQLDADALEKARAEVALRRAGEEIGRSLRGTRRLDRERPWVEDAAAGKLAAGSWAEDSRR